MALAVFPVISCVLSACAGDNANQANAAVLDKDLAQPVHSGAGACTGSARYELPLRKAGAQAFVSLKVNQRDVNLLLDTGDFVTALTPEAAGRLALTESGQPKLQMTGIGGVYFAPVVQAADVQYLDQHVKNLPFAVLPEGEFRPEEHTDGLFGANFLSAYEVEIDFPAGKIRFYQPGSGCDFAGPDWTQGAARLPVRNGGNDLILIPIKVDGVDLTALIDTGSEDTSITQSAARALGITEDATRGDAEITEQGLGNSSEKLHRFASITIGGKTFDNPVLAVDSAPSPIQAAAVTDAMSALPPDHHGIDVILGADYLFRSRIFLAYRQHAFYMNY